MQSGKNAKRRCTLMPAPPEPDGVARPPDDERRARLVGRVSSASIAPDGIAVYVADWCPHCTRFLRQIREKGLAARVNIVDISDDDTDPRWDELSIEVVPTALRWKNGAVVARLDGVLGRGLDPTRLVTFLTVVPE